MNLLKVSVFLLKFYIYQRLNYFEKHIMTYQLQVYMSCFLNLFVIRRLLIKQNMFYFLSAVVLDYHLSRYIIFYYYDSGNSYYLDKDIILLLSILLPLILSTTKEDFEEVERDYVFNYLYKSLHNLIEYTRYRYFILAYNMLIMENSPSNKYNFFQKIIIDFFAIYSYEVICFFYKILSNNTKGNIYILRILKRFIAMIVIHMVFIFLNNKGLTEYFYDKFVYYIPFPHNLILYNAFPVQNETRINLFMFIIFEIFN